MTVMESIEIPQYLRAMRYARSAAFHHSRKGARKQGNRVAPSTFASRRHERGDYRASASRAPFFIPLFCIYLHELLLYLNYLSLYCGYWLFTSLFIGNIYSFVFFIPGFRGGETYFYIHLFVFIPFCRRFYNACVYY